MRPITRICGLALAACVGCKGGSGSTKLTVHVLRGASGGTARIGHAVRPATMDGLWYLSPDQGKVTVDSITFIGVTPEDQQTAVVSGCEPTYQRSAPDLTPIADCTIDAPIGTWSGVIVNVSATASILIDDPTDGLYTTAAGITTTAPATPDFASLTVPNGGNGPDYPLEVFFDQPFVIGSGSPADAATTSASLALLVDMNHTVFANVSGGAAMFNTSLPVPPVSVIAAPTGSGRVTFYSPTGTAGNHDAGAATGDDTGSVRFHYPTDDGQPGFAFFVTPGPGEAYPLDAATSIAGGYLGRDATGTICWANAAQDTSWAHYSQLCEMKELTALGDTTTLSCKHADPAPAPSTGSTYASGCPPMSAPDFTETVTLVAD